MTTQITVTKRQAVAGGAALVLLAAAGLIGHTVLQAPSLASCTLATVTAATIQADVKTCANGAITIPAGTFVLTNHVAVNQPVTITGAGSTLTHLIQSARVNIFQVTANGVTIENMDINTAKYNPGVPPILKNPVPGTVFSNGLNTHVINVSSEAGTGFGMRFTRGSPCDTFQDSGTVITNVTSTNTGTGGFTALDIDCTNGATLTNITIHGDYIAFYQVENVSLIGEFARPNIYNKPCTAPWYVSGPSNHVLLENVDGAGHGVSKASSRGPVTFLTIVANTVLAGC